MKWVSFSSLSHHWFIYHASLVTHLVKLIFTYWTDLTWTIGTFIVLVPLCCEENSWLGFFKNANKRHHQWGEVHAVHGGEEAGGDQQDYRVWARLVFSGQTLMGKVWWVLLVSDLPECPPPDVLQQPAFRAYHCQGRVVHSLQANTEIQMKDHDHLIDPFCVWKPLIMP